MRKLKTLGCLLALLIAGVILFPATAKAADVEINAENFPDSNFRSYVSNNCDKGEKDGILSDSEASAVTSLQLHGREIADLKGIEYFTSLDFLNVNRNKLKSLDLSKNLKLVNLLCAENQLTSLNVSKNTKLESLDCNDNKLSTLDVSANTALTGLNCSNNNLKTLDITKNTTLWSLSCEGNKLTSLDLSKNTVLGTLSCSDNNLGTLDISKLKSLTLLYCINCKLTKLDISASKNLDTLDCHGNSIGTLEIGAAKYLILAYADPDEEDSEDFGDFCAYSHFEDFSGDGYESWEVYSLTVDKATKVTISKPYILQQPKSKTVGVGKKATFTVKAAGSGTLKYQWYYKKPGDTSWTAVSSAAGKKASCSLTAAARHYGYKYRCKVSSSNGYRYSSTVTLTVKTKPVITSPTKAATKTVKKGTTVKFTVKAYAAKTYQWYYRTSSKGDWKMVTAASGKTATYKLKAALRHKGYQYRCKITNPYGTVYSKIFTLKVTS